MIGASLMAVLDGIGGWREWAGDMTRPVSWRP